MTPNPPKTPAKKKAPEPEKPQVFTADIYVSKRLVSSVSLKAANRTAAMLAINKMINVKVK
jgi:hypothetical protein